MYSFSQVSQIYVESFCYFILYEFVCFSDQYMMMNRRKRTEDEERLLKLLQGMKAQDGFTTWCEQMLHALNTSANNSNSSLDGKHTIFN